ncbi:DUF2867 domain-containing protein [bacterium SCSIO 12741]|nr:DUF2867 domain-containing protein [bacterium SCSIO 12741]
MATLQIRKVQAPAESLLFSSKDKYHYIDSFQGYLSDVENKIGARDMAKAFFSSGPSWIGQLFSLRNRIVKSFGLKTSEDGIQNNLDNQKWEAGEQIGLFRLFQVNDREVIMGEDDKHLDFRISLLAEPVEGNQKRLTITTTVVFRNFFGRLYFLPVKPFHSLIVPVMLKGMLRDLDYGKHS